MQGWPAPQWTSGTLPRVLTEHTDALQDQSFNTVIKKDNAVQCGSRGLQNAKPPHTLAQPPSCPGVGQNPACA